MVPTNGSITDSDDRNTDSFLGKLWAFYGIFPFALDFMTLQWRYVFHSILDGFVPDRGMIEVGSYNIPWDAYYDP